MRALPAVAAGALLLAATLTPAVAFAAEVPDIPLHEPGGFTLTPPNGRDGVTIKAKSVEACVDSKGKPGDVVEALVFLESEMVADPDTALLYGDEVATPDGRGQWTISLALPSGAEIGDAFEVIVACFTGGELPAFFYYPEWYDITASGPEPTPTTPTTSTSTSTTSTAPTSTTSTTSTSTTTTEPTHVTTTTTTTVPTTVTSTTTTLVPTTETTTVPVTTITTVPVTTTTSIPTTVTTTDQTGGTTTVSTTVPVTTTTHAPTTVTTAVPTTVTTSRPTTVTTTVRTVVTTSKVVAVETRGEHHHDRPAPPVPTYRAGHERPGGVPASSSSAPAPASAPVTTSSAPALPAAPVATPVTEDPTFTG